MDVWRLVLVAIKEMPRLLLLSVSIWTFESSVRPPLVLVAWLSIGIGFLVHCHWVRSICHACALHVHLLPTCSDPPI